MLEGVVPFPPEFQKRYREKGYWQDKSLAEEFNAAFEKYANRIALIDGEEQVTYAELDRRATNLALNLLAIGLKSLDRVVVQLPNVKEFPILYFALQKLGSIPIAALVTHRYAEISQFARLAAAVACVAPDRIGEFDFRPMIDRICQENEALKHRIILGEAPTGFLSLRELIEKPNRHSPNELKGIKTDPTAPAVFLLSGGTTGIPKLIPRTHNDYAYNSKAAAEVTGVQPDSCLLLVLPIAHNLPLACPGLQGFLLKGARVVLGQSPKPEDVFKLVEKHRVTHLSAVPALLISWINDPNIGKYDLSSVKAIGSGGQRLQPEVRIRAKELIPSAFVQENFGMAEGMLMYVRRDDPEEARLETVGRPVCPDDEIRLVDEKGNEVPGGEVGEFWARGPYTIRGYFAAPEHNARAFSADGFYRTGDLMCLHPSGNYVVAGRIKDLINRGGEKISAEEVENLILQHPVVENVACVPMPDPRLGERMCAYVALKKGKSLTLDELVSFLIKKEIAKFKLPERLELLDKLPVSTFGKVSKKTLVEMITKKLEQEQSAPAK